MSFETMSERRKYPRILLRKPVLASVGATPVFVLDASRGGLRVAHQSQLPPKGAVCNVDLPTDMGSIRLNCAIVHTAIQHATTAAKNLFNTGLEIVSADEESRQRLSKWIGDGKHLK